MAKYVGNKGLATINSVPYNTRNWELSEEVGVLDTTHQASTPLTARTFISDGLRNAIGSFVLDMTESITPIRPTLGVPVAFVLLDENYSYAGDCLITSVSTPVAVGELVTVSVNFQVSGDVEIT